MSKIKAIVRRRRRMLLMRKEKRAKPVDVVREYEDQDN